VQLGSGSACSKPVVEMHTGREAEVQQGAACFRLRGKLCSLRSPGGWSKKIESRFHFRRGMASRGWALARFDPRDHRWKGRRRTQLTLKANQVAQDIKLVGRPAGWSFLRADGSLEQLHKRAIVARAMGIVVFDGACERLLAGARRTNLPPRLSATLLLV